MTITYNDTTYTVTGESIYSDFAIVVADMDEAVAVLTEFDGISTYIFNETEYDNMVLMKRTITVTDVITVSVMLRHKTQTEIAQEEIESLRQALSDLSGSVSSANATKIQSILSKGVSV